MKNSLTHKESLKEYIEKMFGDTVSHYGLNWAGKKNCFYEIAKPTTKTLTPEIDKSIDFENTENIFIEGENLEVLKVLQRSYFGAIKMIYIDPPYNTGKDFVYKDRFARSNEEEEMEAGNRDEEGNSKSELIMNAKSNGKYHSNWLNMMYPRLFLARNLMRDDGVIFVSIDDNEVANLRLIMDEIFGEENFIAQFIWKSKPQGGNDNENIITEHEYVLVFAKNITTVSINGRQLSYNKYKIDDQHKEDRGGYFLGKLDLEVLPYRINLDYPITCPDGTVIYPGSVSYGDWSRRKNGGNKDHDWRWRWSKERFESAIKKDFVIFKKINTKWTCYAKEYEYVDNNGDKIERQAKYRTILDTITTVDGTKDIVSILDGRIFSYPKPIEFIKHFLKIGTNSNDIILDFFVGSGTTAHAVMDLNKEDGGNRKYICVQIPEATDEKSEAYKAEYSTISEITRARITKAGEKIQKEIEETVNHESGLDLGYKSFKLTPSHFPEWREERYKEGDDESLLTHLEDFVAQESTGDDMSRVYELLIKQGKDINEKIEKKDGYFVIGGQVESNDKIVNGDVVVCLAGEVDDGVIGRIVSEASMKRLIMNDKAFEGNDAKKKNIEISLKFLSEKRGDGGSIIFECF